MPSQAMEHAISVFRDRRTARTNQALPTLEEQRAGFAPAGRLYPIPDDVQVTAVDAGGVPASWRMAPGADPAACCCSYTAAATISGRAQPRRAGRPARASQRDASPVPRIPPGT
jgi:hypothetical protein